MTNFSRILNTLTGMHFEDRNQFINSLNRYSLLIIDDLGIERNSDFALEQVFNVIDSRYRSKKPLIITTNLTLSELNNAADIAHKRIMTVFWRDVFLSVSITGIFVRTMQQLI